MRGALARYGPVMALAGAALLPLIVPNEYYLQILTQAYVFAISACGLLATMRSPILNPSASPSVAATMPVAQ